MADFQLSRPASGTSQRIVCESGANFIFDFPATEATLAKNGDNLVISFADGSSIILENFYSEYNA